MAHQTIFLDLLDIKIFCEMGFAYHSPFSLEDRRPSAGIIGKTLGLDARTVRARIRKMEREGFIKYYRALPNYDVLGFRSSAYAFSVSDPAARKEVVRKLSSLEEVTRIEEGLYSVCIFPLYRSEDELRRKLSLFKELLGIEPTKVYDMSMPKVRMKFTVSDWLIIKSLRYDALKSPKKMAQELGLSVPTVKRRFDRLIRERALFI